MIDVLWKKACTHYLYLLTCKHYFAIDSCGLITEKQMNRRLQIDIENNTNNKETSPHISRTTLFCVC